MSGPNSEYIKQFEICCKCREWFYCFFINGYKAKKCLRRQEMENNNKLGVVDEKI